MGGQLWVHYKFFFGLVSTMSIRWLVSSLRDFGFSGYNGSLWVGDSTKDFWGKVSSLWIFGVVECTM